MSTEVLVEGLGLPECPRWHQDRLWFCDLFRRRVSAVGLDGELQVIAEFEDTPSGLGILPDGRPLVALKEGRRLVVLDKRGDAEPYADLSPHGGDHLNDMIVDAAGTAYVSWRAQPVGAFLEPKRPGQDGIVSVLPDGSSSMAWTGLTYPNGIALSDEDQVLTVAETFAARVSRYAIGDAGVREAVLNEPGLHPDGLCVDREGGAWVACVDRGVIRIDGDGSWAPALAVQGEFAMACALGGADGRTLFVMSARTTWTDLAAGRSDGLIRAVAVDIAGDGRP
jgi:sugar lactone lactonase YvrE